MVYNILIANELNAYYFQLFKAGDESGLNYIYDKMNRALRRYGKEICNDDFLIGTLIQDSFLRVWILREKVSSLMHLFRFIKLLMRWQRARYYASISTRHHSRIFFVEYNENLAYSNFVNSTWQDLAEREAAAITAERAVQIDTAIKHLPDYERGIMSLFYHDGFSERQIARKFNNSHQSISNIIRKNTDVLKSFLLRKSLNSMEMKAPERPELIEKLSDTETSIYQMRIIEKYSFERIGMELNMPVEEVLSIYVGVNKLSSKMKSHATKGNYRYKKNTVTY
jgi:DNA-directed RNA polymerase specialized sigma24 family protein